MRIAIVGCFEPYSAIINDSLESKNAQYSRLRPLRKTCRGDFSTIIRFQPPDKRQKRAKMLRFRGASINKEAYKEKEKAMQSVDCLVGGKPVVN